MKKIYFNKNIAIEKNIYDGEDFSLYVKLTNLYKKVFESYLESIIDFKKYDTQILDSNLDFEPSSINYIRPNNLLEYLSSKYFFNLNCFFVENLSIENIKILKDAIEHGEQSYEILSDLIKNTYKEVINDGKVTEPEGRVAYVNYGDDEIEYFRNGALAFKIRYIVTTQTHSREEYLSMSEKRNEIIDKIKASVIEEVESKMGVKCDVLVELCGK